MLKRNFRGFLHKVFTNGSAFRMGSSAGLFALLYKLLFRQLSLALCRVPTTTSTITSDNPDDSVVSGSTAVPDNESLISPTTPIPTSLHRSMRADSGIDLDQEDKILGKGGSGAYREHSTLQMASQLRLQRTWIPAMIAALLASPAFSLIPQQTRRLTISLYFLTYAGETVFSALENEGYTQWMPTWAGPWILFVAASTQLIHAYVHHTECLPETLRKVIQSQCSPYLVKPPNFDTNKWGPFPNTKDTFIGLCNYLVADRKSMPVFVSRELAAAASTASTAEVAKGMFLAPESLRSVMAATEGMGHDSAMCRVFHPTTPSCVQAGIELSGKNTAFALKLYSSFAVLTFLSRGGNVFQHGILNYFKSTAINIVRSSLYTWGFMMTAFTLFCGFERCLPRAILPSKRTYLNGFIGSLWILVESRKRQAALSMYFFRFMLESVWRRMVKSGIVQNIKYSTNKSASTASTTTSTTTITMRLKRSKDYKRYMNMYNQSFLFRTPYQVIVDADFIQAALDQRIDLRTQIPKVLCDASKQMVTPCTMANLKSRGEDGSGAFLASKRFEKRRCPHNSAAAPESDCISKIIGDSNPHNYVIASQSKTLRKHLATVPGVPILYIHRANLILEPPSDASLKKLKEIENSKMHVTDKELQRLKGVKVSKEGKVTIDAKLAKKFEEKLEKKKAKREAFKAKITLKRKGAKEPNPLSIKKKKKPAPAKSEGVEQEKKFKAKAEGGEESPEKKKRRRRKGKGGDAGAQDGSGDEA
ncbi:hypothetical protein BGW38_008087 [Lunasporangiospora selenospora]|uniref:U three protein 23 n=1 Tax=Lunasporangiospora selenospora TaxID=979761 RepID=A0A9P6KGE5_9FUNG|nr:hypothetical protein BGW38_008087 [Lunasporangiospora selenospora]